MKMEKRKEPGLMSSGFETFRTLKRKHKGDLRMVKASLKIAFTMVQLEESGVTLFDNRLNRRTS